MTKTEHYQLNQWDAVDPIHREDFNADNQKIDAALSAARSETAEDLQTLEERIGVEVDGVNAALAALTADVGSGGRTARIAYGTYTGTGYCGSEHPNTLTFDFRPCLVVVGGNKYSGAKPNNPVVLLRGRTVVCSDYVNSSLNSAYVMTVTWTDRSVSWYNETAGEGQENFYNTPYFYVAVGYADTAEE